MASSSKTEAQIKSEIARLTGKYPLIYFRDESKLIDSQRLSINTSLEFPSIQGKAAIQQGTIPM